MRKIFKKLIRLIIYTAKRADKITGYVIGDMYRKIVDINSREYWDKKLASYNKSWRDFPYVHLMEFLPNEEKFSLLDIGCALGDGCLFLKEHFFESDISGADLSPVGIERAKKRTDKIKFFELDITKDDPSKKYDYIITASTLEHINEPLKVVDRCLQCVNTAMLIFVPYEEKFIDARLYGNSEHRYLFNENTFKKYNSEILKITEREESTGYKYIIYKILP